MTLLDDMIFSRQIAQARTFSINLLKILHERYNKGKCIVKGEENKQSVKSW